MEENQDQTEKNQDQVEENEEKEKEKDLPATPPVEASSSEEEWRQRGLNADDIRTKRFRKEQRHRLCEQGKRSLEATQEEMTDSERVENMATALEWASLEERKALEKEKTKKRMEEEIKNRPVAEEQGKKVEELLRDIEKMHVVEKEKSHCKK